MASNKSFDLNNPPNSQDTDRAEHKKKSNNLDLSNESLTTDDYENIIKQPMHFIKFSTNKDKR